MVQSVVGGCGRGCAAASSFWLRPCGQPLLKTPCFPYNSFFTAHTACRHGIAGAPKGECWSFPKLQEPRHSQRLHHGTEFLACVSSAAYEHTELRRQHTMLTNVRRIGIAACRASAFGVRLRTAGCLAGSTQVRCLSSVTAAGDDTRRAGRPFKFYDYVVIGCGSGTTGCDPFM